MIKFFGILCLHFAERWQQRSPAISGVDGAALLAEVKYLLKIYKNLVQQRMILLLILQYLLTIYNFGFGFHSYF